VMSEYSVLSSVAWLLSVISLELSNHYFTFFIKKKIFSRSSILIPVLLILLISIVFEFLSIKGTGYYTGLVIGMSLKFPVTVLIPLGLLAYIWQLNFKSLDRNFYQDDLRQGKKEKIKRYSRYGFLENLGETGIYAALELKMIFRNKRPRSLFYYSLIFLIYPLMFYSQGYGPDYPVPKNQQEESLFQMDKDHCAVSMNVKSASVPEKAFVYIKGNFDDLGNEQEVSLVKKTDGGWSRTFSIKKGRVIYYSFSLGEPEMPALGTDGKPSDKNYLSVLHDTTVETPIEDWKKEGRAHSTGLMVLFWTIFLMSYGGLMYGQFLFGWEGGYFDLLMTRKINLEMYLSAKYLIMIAGSILFFILMLPYAFFGVKVLWFNFAALIYAIGINFPLLIFLGTYNQKRIELNSNMMSSQGKDGWKQFLRGLPMLILMGTIYMVMKYAGWENYTFTAYACVGSIGIIFHKKLIEITIGNFRKKRYSMASGFRQS
jgi:Family of unknown function (DUF5687)